MKPVIYTFLWFLGGVSLIHFLFEIPYGIYTESEATLDVYRFGIYCIISLMYSFFKSRPDLEDKSELLNS